MSMIANGLRKYQFGITDAVIGSGTGRLLQVKTFGLLPSEARATSYQRFRRAVNNL